MCFLGCAYIFLVFKQQDDLNHFLEFKFLDDNLCSNRHIYVYQGIPENAEAPPVARAPASEQTTNAPAQAPQPVQAAVPSGGPNANPLDLFPQVTAKCKHLIYKLLPFTNIRN